MNTEHVSDFFSTRLSRRSVVGGLFAGLASTILSGSLAHADQKHRKRKTKKKKSSKKRDHVTTEIFGGQDVPEGKYPFIAALYWGDTTDPGNQLCSGTLISPRHVLTAKHCVRRDTKRPERITVVVERTDLNQNNGIVVGVSRIQIPRRKKGKPYLDLAVLTLSEEVDAPTIDLPTAEDYALAAPGQLVTIAGWGKASPKKGDYPTVMQEAQVPVVSDHKAKKEHQFKYKTGGKHRRKRKKSEFTPSTMIGAGKRGVDSCTGDSGGPLFDQRLNGTYVQFGVVSWGGKRCGSKTSGVYAQIKGKGLRFIRQAMAA